MVPAPRTQGGPPMSTATSVPRAAAPGGATPRGAGGAGGALRVLDLGPFLAAPVAADPYPHLAAGGCVRPEALPALRRDFPDLRRSGFHPTDAFAPRGAFADLLADVEGPEI